MERVPLDGPNGGRQCEYDDINVSDVVMLEIPWLVSGVVGSTLSYGSLILIFLVAKTTPPNHHL
jgi:hypothetical protein